MQLAFQKLCKIYFILLLLFVGLKSTKKYGEKKMGMPNNPRGHDLANCHATERR